jgi:hypothetical protein
MTNRTYSGLVDFYARPDLTDEQKVCFPVYTEIQDAADAMAGDLPLDQLGGPGAMERPSTMSNARTPMIRQHWRERRDQPHTPAHVRY